ncbi:MAG: SDR family oxidoreductase [Bryobacteraceae bacterium]
MNQALLITGASGVLGRAMVNAALKAGFKVVQAVRDLKKTNPVAPAVRFDYTDPATFAPALAGVSKLFLMAPPLDMDAPAKLSPVIAEAKFAGVEHAVFISAYGVNHDEQAPLRAVEHLVMDSGIGYTILRPNFFMENFSEGFLAAGIKARGSIDLAAGDGKTSFISVQDIAACSVAAFQAPPDGQEYDLTGAEALDHAEVARIISEASGRPIEYHSLYEEEMLAGARAAGMPEPVVRYLAALYSAVRAGHAAAITGDVEKLTGRTPIRFAEFARAAAASWR